jgi:hypothetical protein
MHAKFYIYFKKMKLITIGFLLIVLPQITQLGTVSPITPSSLLKRTYQKPTLPLLQLSTSMVFGSYSEA